MGTAVPVEPLEGKKYKTLFSTMKAFVAVAMAAAAQAAPEADPQLLLANPEVYGTAHTQTLGMVHHANGAVVPDDTLSVKAAKVDHLNAKATAYLNKPIVPVVQTVAAKPVVQTVASPVVSYSGLYNPYGLLNTHLFKRGAEAEAEADPLTVYHGVQAPLTYTGMYNYQLPVVAKTVVPTVAKTVVPTVAKTVIKAPVVYSGLNYGLNYGPVYNTHLIKREAEADSEADPAVFYNNYGYGYPAYTGVYGYNYPAVQTVAAKTVVPAVAKTVVQTPVVAKSVYSGLTYGLDYGLNYPAVYNTHLIKREAEAEADPAVFYNYYNAPAYTAGVYNGYTGYTTGLNYAYNPVYGYNNYGYNYLY